MCARAFALVAAVQVNVHGVAAFLCDLPPPPPPASPASRLVVQVAAATPVGDALELSPTLAPLAVAWPILPADIVVLLSATPREALAFAKIAFALPHAHVVHVFDHFAGAREQLPAADSLPPAPAPLSELLRAAGSAYFEYSGPAAPATVLVMLNGPLALAAAALGAPVLIVRVLRPWDDEAFAAALPPSAKTVYVFDDVPTPTAQGPLFADVLGALLGSPGAPTVLAHRTVPAQTAAYFADPKAFSDLLFALAPTKAAAAAGEPFSAPQLKKLLFFGGPHAPLGGLPAYIAAVFRAKHVLAARLLRTYDAFSKTGGIAADRLLLAPVDDATSQAIPLPLAIPLGGAEGGGGGGASDLLCVLDAALLKTHDLLLHAKPGSSVLVFAPWAPAEVVANLSADVKARIVARGLHVYVYHAEVEGEGSAPPLLEAYLAFLRLYLGPKASEALVAATATALFGGTAEGASVAALSARAWGQLEKVDVVAEAALLGEAEPPKHAAPPLKTFTFNAVAPAAYPRAEAGAGQARLGSWHDAARHILFPSAYAPRAPLADGEGEEDEDHEYEEYAAPRQDARLRPDAPERTFLVTTAVNRRLTPREYDRNVFHLELDTRGTGLTYAIGEALGVHGWNDAAEAQAFLAWYGADGDRVITLPVPGAVEGDGVVHARTVFQAFQQQVDLFGKPPKAFYTELAAHATAELDRHALLFIGSPEGVSTFKKLAEVDTVNYADVLRMYPSARPGAEVLAGLVGDIKPRHYSIASAQSVVGDRVDLLVVTVDWVTPSGSPRYGQCTRYLAGLTPGQQVTVSIKPSVMKLPPLSTQPIIMAGLGTGAAPFRAFLQDRALLAGEGAPVGPVYYYFGSRHRASEYLYGEELEAYIADGTIARAGLAFSRDGKKGEKKVYIQHRMLEDAEALVRMLHDEKGVFYLCGPTWPVPDIYEALVGALVKYKGFTAEGAGAYLEGLKEEERYVLEVY
ncbi:hypothetical protein FIBSPDRAFT_909826 [Athelia psychrophila]|uniref:assimilatory sulfite reductase (NADPH) n=1 Tax=Athelia psychrophila TaxID=1759441 RepID=A0A166N145_9AGAM|nr:hypothetical protein FIBSPDRAFT_909826 [Fibularhizoctonia sp. CBS 109695]